MHDVLLWYICSLQLLSNNSRRIYKVKATTGRGFSARPPPSSLIPAGRPLDPPCGFV